MKLTEPTGDTIRAMRESLKLSQEALARELEVSWKTISRYEGAMPPNGGALLRFISYAESKGLEDFAAKFRRAYVSEVGERGTSRIAAAWESLVFTILVIRDLKEASTSPEESVKLDELLLLVIDALRNLAGVLPIIPGTLQELGYPVIDPTIVGDFDEWHSQAVRELMDKYPVKGDRNGDDELDSVEQAEPNL